MAIIFKISRNVVQTSAMPPTKTARRGGGDDKLRRRYERHKETELLRRRRMKHAVDGMRSLLGLNGKVEQADVLDAALEYITRVPPALAQPQAKQQSQEGPITMAREEAAVTTRSMRCVPAMSPNTTTDVSSSSSPDPSLPIVALEGGKDLVAVSGSTTPCAHCDLLHRNSFDFARDQLCLDVFEYASPSLDSRFLPSDVPILIMNLNQRILDCNEALIRLVEAPDKQTLLGYGPGDSVVNSDMELVLPALLDLVRGDRDVVHAYLRLRTFTSAVVWLQLNLTRVESHEGLPRCAHQSFDASWNVSHQAVLFGILQPLIKGPGDGIARAQAF